MCTWLAFCLTQQTLVLGVCQSKDALFVCCVSLTPSVFQQTLLCVCVRDRVCVHYAYARVCQCLSVCGGGRCDHVLHVRVWAFPLHCRCTAGNRPATPGSPRCVERQTRRPSDTVTTSARELPQRAAPPWSSSRVFRMSTSSSCPAKPNAHTETNTHRH